MYSRECTCQPSAAVPRNTVVGEDGHSYGAAASTAALAEIDACTESTAETRSSEM